MEMNDIQQKILRDAYDNVVQKQEALAVARAHLNNLIMAMAGGPAKLDRNPDGSFVLVLDNDDDDE